MAFRQTHFAEWGRLLTSHSTLPPKPQVNILILMDDGLLAPIDLRVQKLPDTLLDTAVMKDEG